MNVVSLRPRSLATAPAPEPNTKCPTCTRCAAPYEPHDYDALGECMRCSDHPAVADLHTQRRRAR